MERKNKIILLILLLIIIVPIVYFGFLEESIFYNTIKEVSDIENKSDAVNDVLRNQTNPSVEDYVDYQIESVNTTSNEILMLQGLKSIVFSEPYVEYIDIQINRLNCENRTYSAMLENGNIYMNNIKMVKWVILEHFL